MSRANDSGLVTAGRKAGRDVSEGETVLNGVKRIIASNTHWSPNDAWYIELRDCMARAIVKLNKASGTRE